MGRAMTLTTDTLKQGTAALPTAAGSLSFWLRPNWVWNDGVWHSPFSQVVDGNNEFNCLKFSDNNWYVGWKTASVDHSIVVSATGLVQNAWNHLCITWNLSATRTRFYVNGTQIGATATLTTHSTAGRDRDLGNDTVRTASDLLNGTLAEFALWNAELTAGDVTTLQTRTPNVIPAGLLDYLPLNADLVAVVGGVNATASGGSFGAHPSLVGPGGAVNRPLGVGPLVGI